MISCAFYLYHHLIEISDCTHSAHFMTLFHCLCVFRLQVFQREEATLKMPSKLYQENGRPDFCGGLWTQYCCCNIMCRKCCSNFAVSNVERALVPQYFFACVLSVMQLDVLPPPPPRPSFPLSNSSAPLSKSLRAALINCWASRPTLFFFGSCR